MHVCMESKDRMRGNVRKWTKGEMKKGKLNERKRKHERTLRKKDRSQSGWSSSRDEAIARLKTIKETAENGLEKEALKCVGIGVTEEMWSICNKVWKGEGWLVEWKTGLVVPLIMIEEDKRVEKYKGMILMSVEYKIYTDVVKRRFKRQLEEQESIPHSLTSFRKGMGTRDKIYVLNYIVNINLG